MTTSRFTPSIYGTGFSYPLRLDKDNAKLAIARDEALVQEGMRVLLNTAVGEEPFLVKDGVPYGTRAPFVVFEPVAIAQDIIVYDVRRALEVWEPRIIVTGVTVDEATLLKRKALVATVRFRYRTTNRNDNLVVPYFTEKAPR
jgi:phage baseplate assembly protein W